VDAATGQDEAAVLARHRELLAEGRVQWRLEQMPAPEPPNLGWLKWLADNASWLQWIAYALGALLLALLLRRLWFWWQARGRAPAADADAGWRPDAAQARDLLAEADALAAAGRYGEAAHLILIRSVEHIAARDPRAVVASLTSRDIAGLPGLAAPVRSAFGTIAGIVERWLFAGGDAAADDWSQARAAYAGVANPLQAAR
jgi:hypothetical protein